MNPSSVSRFSYLGEGCTVEFKRSGTSELERGKCVSANATWEVILVGSADDGEVCEVGHYKRLKPDFRSIACSAVPPIGAEIDNIRPLCFVHRDDRSR